jgi:hypothetical protein
MAINRVAWQAWRHRVREPSHQRWTTCLATRVQAQVLLEARLYHREASAWVRLCARLPQAPRWTSESTADLLAARGCLNLERQPLSRASVRYTRRLCLRCDRVIRSEGPHHRLCEVCRAHNASTYDPPIYPWHAP